MLNVLVACKEVKTPGGLQFAGDVATHYDTHPSWGQASNLLLAKAQALGGDALFLDDDVTLTDGCLDHVYKHYDKADVFGLDLHDMTGARQAGARHMMDKQGGIHDWVLPGPAYVAHVSTSAIYLKASAVEQLRFPIWDGIHWEDVAFCLDAWLHGLKVLAVPGYVEHQIVAGVGATKRHAPEFWDKWAKNMRALGIWCADNHVMPALRDGRIPVGAVEL